MKPKLIVGLLLLVLVTVFMLQNTEVVTINFLFWDFALSRSLMILAVFAAGLVAGWFLKNMYRIRMHRK